MTASSVESDRERTSDLVLRQGVAPAPPWLPRHDIPLGLMAEIDEMEEAPAQLRAKQEG